MQLTYALRPETYSSNYAFFFDVCYGHLSKGVSDDAFGHRIVHLAIGILEAIPLVGQIASLFEKIIVENYNWSVERNETIERVEDLYDNAVRGQSFPLDLSEPGYLQQQPAFKELRDKIKRQGCSLYPQDVVQKIKDLASFPELIEAREALKMGIAPQMLPSGVNGSYVLLGRRRQKIGIFKPGEQELGSEGNPKGFGLAQSALFGIQPGTGYQRERVAYLLDKKNHFAGVPMTKITTFERGYFPSPFLTHTEPGAALKGSFQKWVPDAHIAYDDYQVLPSFLSRANGRKIPADEIHKIAVFDIRVLNCDRHLQNFLIDSSLTRAYPIDHGYTCPGDAGSLRFDWIGFPQAKIPFSEHTLQYIQELDPTADAELIRRKIPSVAEDTLARMKIATRLLQIAARRGLTAYQIADLFMRRHHEGLAALINRFVPVPSPTPSYFETRICQTVLAIPDLDLDEFLEVEVNRYLNL